MTGTDLEAAEATIKAAILGFHWWDYGLDEVDRADPEYAQHLAEKIQAALTVFTRGERVDE